MIRANSDSEMNTQKVRMRQQKVIGAKSENETAKVILRRPESETAKMIRANSDSEMNTQK